MVFVKGRFGRFAADEKSEASVSEEKGIELGPENGRGTERRTSRQRVAQEADKKAESKDSFTGSQAARLGAKGGSRSPQARQASQEFLRRVPELPGDPLILNRGEHCISRKNIDPDALKVLRRMNRHGCKAYLVGGAVRDLLLQKRPKDYDVATDASPEVVRTMFRNSRIIGRRFRINHVYFRGNKIIEVSTFRDIAESSSSKKTLLVTSDNIFGDPQTDAVRRDLTINGLFYDLSTFSVIDYVGGIEDLRDGVIRIIGEPEVRIQEDPVRMIRAVRHAAQTGFEIEPQTYGEICRLKALIKLCSSARVFEEFMRELRGGHSRESFTLLDRTGLLPYLLPVLSQSLEENREEVWKRLANTLSKIDQITLSGKEFPASVLLLALLIGNLPLHYYAAAEEEREERLLLDHWRVSPKSVPQTEQEMTEAEGDGKGFVARMRLARSSEFASRKTRRGKVSPLGKMIALFFEGVGLSRRDREQMEHLLISRRIMLSEGSQGVDREVLQSPYFDDAMVLLRFTAHDEVSRQSLDRWKKKLAAKHSKRRRRRRSRRRSRPPKPKD